jgi:hypothetical protein
MPNQTIRLEIRGDGQAVNDYWENLAHISPEATDSELSVRIDDLVIRVIRTACAHSDIVVSIVPSDNKDSYPIEKNYCTVQWVELERRIESVGGHDMVVAVKSETPGGVLAIVWAEDTWIPITRYLEAGGWLDAKYLGTFHRITDGRYWG